MSMRRFTRAEDLEGLEQIGRLSSFSQQQQLQQQQQQRHSGDSLYPPVLPPTELSTLHTPLSSLLPLYQQPEDHVRNDHIHPYTCNSNSTSTFTSRDAQYHCYPQRRHRFSFDSDNDSLASDHAPSRQYIETHTTFLDSSDLNSSGVIPNPPPPHHSQHHHHHHHHQHPHYSQQYHRRENSFSASGTPSSSFLSSPSIGFYSQRSSRPSSRMGYWLDDQDEGMMASSMNLVMPSSAMFFVKCREPTEHGQNLGFVKVMFCGDNRDWQNNLVQLFLRDWHDMIACDFDDNHHQPHPASSPPRQQQLQSQGRRQQQPAPSSYRETHVHHLRPDTTLFKNSTTSNASADTATSSPVLVGGPVSSREGPFLPREDASYRYEPTTARLTQGGGDNRDEQSFGVGGNGEEGREGGSTSVPQAPFDTEAEQSFPGTRWTRSELLGAKAEGTGTGTTARNDMPSMVTSQEYMPDLHTGEGHDPLHSFQSPLRTTTTQPHIYSTVTERFASTTVLPAWAREGYNDQEAEQDILIKNVCLVNTPGGFRTSTHPEQIVDPVLAYLGLQFQTTNEFFSRSVLSDDALGRFLVSNITGAHTHVDMCLYMVHDHLWPIDIQFMKQLTVFVNVVPVLVPTEGTPPSQVMLDRLKLRRQLHDHGINVYGMDTDEPLEEDTDEDDEARPGSGRNHNGDDGIRRSSASIPRRASQVPDPLISVPLTPFLSPPFVLYLTSSATSSSLNTSPHFAPSNSNYNSSGISAATQDATEDKVSQLNILSSSSSSESQQQNLSPHPSPPPVDLPPPVDKSLLDLWDSQQMHILRDWMLTTHLAALRYHTTLKFLAWRRELPWITLSDSLYSERASNSTGNGPIPSGGGIDAGSDESGASCSVRRSGVPYAEYAALTRHHHPPLPSDHMSHLQARNQQRVAEAMTKILDSDAVVLRRIVEERQEAWRRALGQMEREDRFDFLVDEIKKWARETGSSRERRPDDELASNGIKESSDRRLEDTFASIDGATQSATRVSDLSSNGGRERYVGLGLDQSLGLSPFQQQQQLHPLPEDETTTRRTTVARPASGLTSAPTSTSPHTRKQWSLSSSSRSRIAAVTPKASSSSSSARTRPRGRRETVGRDGNGGGRDAVLWDTRPVLSLKASPPAHRCRSSSPQMIEHPYHYDNKLQKSMAEEEDDAEACSQSDPLGLGSVIGRLLGAIGRGIINAVVVVTMTGFAQVVYSNFLEHANIEWIL